GLGKWLVFSRNTFLWLGFDHLIQPTGNKNSEVLLSAGIFSATFLGIKPQTDDVAIALSDRLEPRFGRGGVADLRRISKINVQHGENVRLVVLRPRISSASIFFRATAGACAQGKRSSQEHALKPEPAVAHHCFIPGTSPMRSHAITLFCFLRQHGSRDRRGIRSHCSGSAAGESKKKTLLLTAASSGYRSELLIYTGMSVPVARIVPLALAVL